MYLPRSLGHSSNPFPRTCALYTPFRGLLLIALFFLCFSPRLQAQTFSNTNPIVIPNALVTQGPGSLYPSPITVAGAGPLASLTITLSNFSHAYADDIDVLLVGPTGLNILLMSDCGGLNPFSSLNLIFSASALLSLSDTTALASGSYLPTNFDAPFDVDSFAAPAPLTGPYGSSLAAFNGTNPNGVWRLYVLDDTQGNNGTLAGGWSLSITSVPEPSSFLLGAGGLALVLGLAARRRLRRSCS